MNDMDNECQMTRLINESNDGSEIDCFSCTDCLKAFSLLVFRNGKMFIFYQHIDFYVLLGDILYMTSVNVHDN